VRQQYPVESHEMSISGNAVGTLRQRKWHIAAGIPAASLTDFMARQSA
jgi:hypothetical protein